MRFHRANVQSVSTAKLVFVLAPICGVLLTGTLDAGTISAQASSLGANQFEYQFTFQGFDLLKDQEIDIRFSPAAFGGLFNGVAGSGFQLTVLQPNNPVGAFGDYSILATVDHPSLSGPFQLDITALQAQPPLSLPYVVHQFDTSGQRILGVIDSGEVTPLATAPEPGGFWLAGAAFLVGGLLGVARARS